MPGGKKERKKICFHCISESEPRFVKDLARIYKSLRESVWRSEETRLPPLKSNLPWPEIGQKLVVSTDVSFEILDFNLKLHFENQILL